MGTSSSFLRVKRPVRKADHSLLSSAGARNVSAIPPLTHMYLWQLHLYKHHNKSTLIYCDVLWHQCTMLQVILTPTCRVSGYPRQVIKVATLLRQLRFIWTALPTVITLITIIPLGTYNTSSWYIFLFRDDATQLVHLSSLMTAVCLSLLTKLLHWTSCFLSSLLPFTTVDLFSLSTIHWLLSFYNFGLTGYETPRSTIPLLFQRV
jgi:hypothetical protein